MIEAQSRISGILGQVAGRRTQSLAGRPRRVAEVEEGGARALRPLVERGRPVEERQKKVAEAVTDRASQAARELTKLVEDTVEFEGRGMLKRLNLMTREDVSLLTARVESLSRKIDEYVVRHDLDALEVPVILNAEGEPAVKLEKLDTLEPVKAKAARKAAAPRQRQAVKTAAKTVAAKSVKTEIKPEKTVKAAKTRGKKG